MQDICSECGARNEAGAGFCAFCHTFLAWDDDPGKTSTRPDMDDTMIRSLSPRDIAAWSETPSKGDTPAAVSPAKSGEPPPAAGTDPAADTAAGRLRVVADQSSVDLAATGEPAVVNVRIANISTIVDGYAVEAPDAPEWLRVEGGQVQLLPGTEETVPLQLHVVSSTLVPAQEVQLTLRIKSLSQTPAHVDFAVAVVVLALDVPVRVHAEPSMLRVRDKNSAECRLVVDNSASNRSVHLSFSGADPELVVGFAFDPPELDVAPGATGAVVVTATAPGPDPGQVVSRSLTITAHDGEHSFDTHVTLQQSSAERVEDPPVVLEAHPSLLRVEGDAAAALRIVADNRGGSKWAHLTFMATDPEGVVRVLWIPSQIDVPPGKMVQVEAMLEAPPPAAGSEVSRVVTMKALDGPRVSTTTATLVQATSVSPMTTLELRVEPSVVRAHDAPSASVQVMVDNRRGRSAARVSLKGSDPEKAIWFNFSPTAVEVPAGQVQSVALRLDSWCPPPGEEASREFTIGASDGQAVVKSSGTFVQTSSRDAIELLSVRLDPRVLRLERRRRGSLLACVDNRAGAQPVRVSMTGDDPENGLGFTFEPAVLAVPAGHMANTRVTVTAERSPSAEEVTRPFTIMASDGRSDVTAAGELVQAAAQSYRLLARVMATVIGGLAMVFGAFLPWFASDSRRGVALDPQTLAETFRLLGRPIDELQFLSAGLVFIVLAVLAVFGLTGRTGRVTRLAALLGALLLIGLFVAFAVRSVGLSPGPGTYVAFAGCVVAYVGGLLVRR